MTHQYASPRRDFLAIFRHRCKIKAIGMAVEDIASTDSISGAVPSISPGWNVLEILLTTIENQFAPKQQREDAKEIIREWLKKII